MISVWISLAQLPPRLPVSSGGPTIEKTSALDIQVAEPLAPEAGRPEHKTRDGAAGEVRTVAETRCAHGPEATQRRHCASLRRALMMGHHYSISDL